MKLNPQNAAQLGVENWELVVLCIFLHGLSIDSRVTSTHEIGGKW